MAEQRGRRGKKEERREKRAKRKRVCGSRVTGGKDHGNGKRVRAQFTGRGKKERQEKTGNSLTGLKPPLRELTRKRERGRR